MSLSCGSLWFIDAGRVSFVETPISPRYLSQDDRIEIADGHARGEPVKQIAARIGKSYQTVSANWPGTERATGAISHGSRTTRRICGDDGSSHAGSRWRPDYARRWPASSPALVSGEISRWLRRRFPRRRGWQVCTETIYEAVYRGLIVPIDRRNLRTGRI